MAGFHKLNSVFPSEQHKQTKPLREPRPRMSGLTTCGTNFLGVRDNAYPVITKRMFPSYNNIFFWLTAGVLTSKMQFHKIRIREERIPRLTYQSAYLVGSRVNISWWMIASGSTTIFLLILLFFRLTLSSSN